MTNRRVVWIVPCRSLRKTGSDPVPSEPPTRPTIPSSWERAGSTYWFVDARVLAESGDDATRLVAESDYPVEPLDDRRPRRASGVLQQSDVDAG